MIFNFSADLRVILMNFVINSNFHKYLMTGDSECRHGGQGSGWEEDALSCEVSSLRRPTVRAAHGHLHSIDIDGKAGIDELLVHASVKRLLLPSIVDSGHMCTACLLGVDWPFACIPFDTWTARRHILRVTAHIVNAVHKVLVKLHLSRHLVITESIFFMIDSDFIIITWERHAIRGIFVVVIPLLLVIPILFVVPIFLVVPILFIVPVHWLFIVNFPRVVGCFILSSCGWNPHLNIVIFTGPYTSTIFDDERRRRCIFRISIFAPRIFILIIVDLSLECLRTQARDPDLGTLTFFFWTDVLALGAISRDLIDAAQHI